MLIRCYVFILLSYCYVSINNPIIHFCFDESEKQEIKENVVEMISTELIVTLVSSLWMHCAGRSRTCPSRQTWCMGLYASRPSMSTSAPRGPTLWSRTAHLQSSGEPSTKTTARTTQSSAPQMASKRWAQRGTHAPVVTTAAFKLIILIHSFSPALSVFPSLSKDPRKLRAIVHWLMTKGTVVFTCK